jgi:hypothetical protein
VLRKQGWITTVIFSVGLIGVLNNDIGYPDGLFKYVIKLNGTVIDPPALSVRVIRVDPPHSTKSGGMIPFA